MYSCIPNTEWDSNSFKQRSRIRYLSKKHLTNFPKLKKNRKNSYKNSLNARVGVTFQWNNTAR